MEETMNAEWKKLKQAKRVIVKVGSNTLTHETGNLNLTRMELLVREMVNIKNQGREVIFVSSGAVAAGIGRLGLRERPKEISARQALAAIGQGLLMHTYEKFFGEYGITVAQVLLTMDDFADRARYLNARTTIRQILSYNAVPIINENDTVAFDEIKVGENDILSAMMAGLADADLLVLLSDVDGLYTANPKADPQARQIPVVEHITPEIEALAGGAGSMLGSGGMKTKIAAARVAVSQGIPVVLTNGSRRECLRFLSDDDGHDEGAEKRATLFLPRSQAMGSRKGWLAFSTRPAGRVYVDAGAAKALIEKGRSLLASGILRVEGGFSRGEIVEIREGDTAIARGIINYGAGDLELIKGKSSGDFEAILGPGHDQEVVHRDNMSMWM